MSNPPPRRRSLLDGPTLIGEPEVVTSAQTDKRRPWLLQVQGPGAPRQFVLDLDETVVGRSQSAHVSIESNTISRSHMAVRRAGTQLRCVDLNSANGVYLNGVKAHSALLCEGDTVQIGDVLFIFHEGD